MPESRRSNPAVALWAAAVTVLGATVHAAPAYAAPAPAAPAPTEPDAEPGAELARAERVTPPARFVALDLGAYAGTQGGSFATVLARLGLGFAVPWGHAGVSGSFGATRWAHDGGSFRGNNAYYLHLLPYRSFDEFDESTWMNSASIDLFVGTSPQARYQKEIDGEESRFEGSFLHYGLRLEYTAFFMLTAEVGVRDLRIDDLPSEAREFYAGVGIGLAYGFAVPLDGRDARRSR